MIKSSSKQKRQRSKRNLRRPLPSLLKTKSNKRRHKMDLTHGIAVMNATNPSMEEPIGSIAKLAIISVSARNAIEKIQSTRIGLKR